MSKQFLMVDYDLMKLKGKYDGITIGADEILLLALIINLSQNQNMKYPTCAASNVYICSVLGVEERTLRRQLKKLESLNLIKKFLSYEKGSYRTTLRLIYVQDETILGMLSDKAPDTLDMNHRTDLVEAPDTFCKDTGQRR